MPDKIAIVTGSSSGIGLLTAIELAKNGFKVVATMRDLERRAHSMRPRRQSRSLDDSIYVASM